MTIYLILLFVITIILYLDNHGQFKNINLNIKLVPQLLALIFNEVHKNRQTIISQSIFPIKPKISHNYSLPY